MIVVGTMMQDRTTGLAYEPCRYGTSRLSFRGPPKPLDGRHVAILGGSETLGRALPETYADLLERALGETCVNLGQNNASVEAFLHDSLVPNVCADAMATVLSVTGAANLSNRLYSVHPRRNDRFLRPSAMLCALYPSLDLTEVCFTRHLLLKLHEAAPARFESVREELRTAWASRMRTLLDRIGSRVVLLWLMPEEGAGVAGPLGPDPLFVTARMVESLRPLVRDIVAVPAGPLDAAAHRRAAAALLEPVRRLLPPAGLRALA